MRPGSFQGLVRRLVDRVTRWLAPRPPPPPTHRLVDIILLSALRHEVARVVVELREDDDLSSWPPVLDDRSGSKIADEIDDGFDNAVDFAEETGARGACGVFFHPRAGPPRCEMRPPALLGPAIRDRLLSLAGIDPRRCLRHRNGYRYHGRPHEQIEGRFALERQGRPRVLFAVRYEVDFDAERIAIDLHDEPLLR